MAARRASAQFLTIFQRSSISTSVQPFVVPRQATAFSIRRLHSEKQSKLDDEHTEDYESNKMSAEGGVNFQRESEKVKNQAGEKIEGTSEEVKETVKETASATKNQVDKNVDTAKEMSKDFPQKVSETATGLKEVGVEAAKSIQRDAGKIAQKVGLKSED